MELLEREPFLDSLGGYARDAASGTGRLVLVAGEAGIGKTSLVDTFRAAHPEMRWLWGACDGGFTPRPLGPLYDIAASAGGRLRELCRAEPDRNELFAEFLSLLAAGTPTGVVIEDVHWADEATLDWLSHVSRRLAALPVLVLVTYRDDEPDDGHLAGVMGRLAAHASTRRITVPPLTPAAVARLAGEKDGHEVHALTGGNPFYVGEVVALADGAVPPSVADVVRARVLRHSPPAQRILAGAAVLGRPATAEMLASVTGLSPSVLDECVASGTLLFDGPNFAFRHELTRRAVEEAVPRVQAAELHRVALVALERDGADAAELAHHALRAGDVDAVLRHAPAAGRAAAEASAHREGIIHLRRALEYADRLEPRDHADLAEALALSLSTRDQWSEAEVSWRKAIALRRTLDDPEALSRCLRRYARCLWRLCRTEEGRLADEEAYELMRDADDSAERAQVHYIRGSSEHIALEDRRAAIDECARIGKDLGDDALLGRALHARATLDYEFGDLDLDDLVAALEHGLRSGDHGLAACIYANLYECSVDLLRLDEFSDRYDEALTYALDHEQHTWSVCLRGTKVAELLRRGHNPDAVELALRTMEETISPANRMILGIGLTRAGFRLGRPEARRWLDDTWQLGEDNGETFWLIQIATAAVEGSWLAGDPTLVTPRVHEIYRDGLLRYPWVHGDLSAWLARLGHLVDPAREVPAPYALELAGGYADAAEAWHEIGAPFEEAVALTWTRDADSMRRALQVFTDLGSAPAAANVRRLLQEKGISVPTQRGPRATTAAHPAGLTAREAEVLDVMRGGLTNAQIAQRLYLSPRTVDHHVSSILGKLGVASRADAAARAGALTADPATR